MEKALDALEKAQDDAQIFGDFIASSIRELDSVDKQHALKRALNRALLDFQDAQHQAPYQASYQPPYQTQYQATPFASTLNPTTSSSHSQLPPFSTINQNLDSNDPFGSQTCSTQNTPQFINKDTQILKMCSIYLPSRNSLSIHCK